jgi:hypothetical protein
MEPEEIGRSTFAQLIKEDRANRANQMWRGTLL